YPPLEKLQKEGESGRKKINEYTRYATVPICIIQAYMIVGWLMSPGQQGGALYVPGYNGAIYWISAILMLTAGTMFLMWLGEQIDEYGIGNGISLIIMAGIVSRIPQATSMLLFDLNRSTTVFGFKVPALKESILTLGGGLSGDVSFEKLVVLIFLFVAVV